MNNDPYNNDDYWMNRALKAEKLSVDLNRRLGNWKSIAKIFKSMWKELRDRDVNDNLMMSKYKPYHPPKPSENK